MPGLGDAWGDKEELLHPRGPDGRWIKRGGMLPGIAGAILRLMGDFSRSVRTFQSRGQANQYAWNLSHSRRKKGGKVVPMMGRVGHERLAADLPNANEDLRDGKIDDPSTARFVQMMDDAAIEAPDSIIVSRMVGTDAFGFTPETANGVDADNPGIRGMAGKLIADRAYSLGSVSGPLQNATPGPGRVRMIMAVPKGTKIIVPGGNPNDSSIFLDRGQPMRATKVEPDGAGGWNMYVVATESRYKGEVPEPIGGRVGQRVPSTQDREAKVERIRRIGDRMSKSESDETVEAKAAEREAARQEMLREVAANPPAQRPDRQAPIEETQPPPPGTPPARTEPVVTESIGGDPAPGEPAQPQAPVVEEPAVPNRTVDLRRAVQDADIPAPAAGPKRKLFNDAYEGVISGKKDPIDAARELDRDARDLRAAGDDDADSLEKLSKLIKEQYGLESPRPGVVQKKAPPAPAPEVPRTEAGLPAIPKAEADAAMERQKEAGRTLRAQRQNNQGAGPSPAKKAAAPATPKEEQDARVQAATRDRVQADIAETERQQEIMSRAPAAKKATAPAPPKTSEAAEREYKAAIRREIRSRPQPPLTPEQEKRRQEVADLAELTNERTRKENEQEDAADREQFQPWLDAAGVKESDLSEMDKARLFIVTGRLRRGRISKAEAVRLLRDDDNKDSPRSRIADALASSPRKQAAKKAAPAAGGDPLDSMTKADLLAEAEKRDVKVTKSWTKDRIKAALRGEAPEPRKRAPVKKAPAAKIKPDLSFIDNLREPAAIRRALEDPNITAADLKELAQRLDIDIKGARSKEQLRDRISVNAPGVPEELRRTIGESRTLAKKAAPRASKSPSSIAEEISAVGGGPQEGRLDRMVEALQGHDRTKLRDVAKELGIQIPVRGSRSEEINSTNTDDGLRLYIARNLDSFGIPNTPPGPPARTPAPRGIGGDPNPDTVRQALVDLPEMHRDGYINATVDPLNTTQARRLAKSLGVRGQDRNDKSHIKEAIRAHFEGVDPSLLEPQGRPLRGKARERERVRTFAKEIVDQYKGDPTFEDRSQIGNVSMRDIFENQIRNPSDETSFRDLLTVQMSLMVHEDSPRGRIIRDIIDRYEGKSPDLEQGARDRQTRIDRVKRIGELSGFLEEGVNNEGSSDAIATRMRGWMSARGVATDDPEFAPVLQALALDDQAAARQAMDDLLQFWGVTRLDNAGDVVPFDRVKHQGITDLEDGTMVHVVRPGHRHGDTLLERSTVEAATSDEIQAHRLVPKGSVAGPRAQTPVDNRPRKRELREAWREAGIPRPKGAPGRQLDEIKEKMLAGDLAPEDGIRMLESEIAFNKEDRTELEAHLREADLGPEERREFEGRLADLDGGIEAQETTSKFLRLYFADETVSREEIKVEIVPEVKRELPKETVSWLDEAKPEDIEESARQVGLDKLEGDTAEEKFQDALRQIAQRELESRQAKKAAPAKKAAKKAAPVKKAAPPKVPVEKEKIDARLIAEDLNLDESDEWTKSVLDEVQRALDGEDIGGGLGPNLTPAAIGRHLEERGHSRMTTAVYMHGGWHHDNRLNEEAGFPGEDKERRKAEDKAAYDEIKDRVDKIRELAERLKKTRRRPAKKAAAPATPAEEKVDVLENRIINDALDRLREGKTPAQRRAAVAGLTHNELRQLSKHTGGDGTGGRNNLTDELVTRFTPEPAVPKVPEGGTDQEKAAALRRRAEVTRQLGGMRIANNEPGSYHHTRGQADLKEADEFENEADRLDPPNLEPISGPVEPSDATREIADAVQRGDISPDEAARRLQGMTPNEREARGQRLRELRQRALADLREQGFPDPRPEMVEQHMATLREQDQTDLVRARSGGGARGPVLPSGADIETVSSGRDLSNNDIVQGHHLTPAGRRALDALGPAGHPRIAAIPDTEGKIREAYRMLAISGGRDHYVGFEDLRKLLGEQVPRTEVDETLRRMNQMPDVYLSPQHYGRHNSATRIPAAVKMGGQDNDQIHIDDPTLFRPSDVSAVELAEELQVRRDGGDRDPRMSLLSEVDLRVAIDDRATRDPIVARDLKAMGYNEGTAPVKKTAAPAAPGSTARAILDDLAKVDENNVPTMSRTEAMAMIKDRARTKKILQEAARELSIPRASSLTMDELRREIVDATVGRRLDSIATRGFTGPRPEQPGVSLDDPNRPRLRSFDEVARGTTAPPPVQRADPALPIRRADRITDSRGMIEQRERPKADEPVYLPNGGSDQGRVHLDSDLGTLWADLYLDNREPNSFINEIAHIGEEVGMGKLPLATALTRLKAMKARATDSAVADRIQTAIDNMDAPGVTVPDLPDTVPAAVKKALRDLAEIPTARRTGRVGMGRRDRSVFDEKLDIVRRIDAGDEDRQLDMKLRNRDLHESVDGALEMWRIFERLLDSREIRLWRRDAYRRAHPEE